MLSAPAAVAFASLCSLSLVQRANELATAWLVHLSARLASLDAFVFPAVSLIGCALRWPTSFADCWSIVRDNIWLLLSLILGPIFGVCGIERRCYARALHLEPPLAYVDISHIDTATVNGGKDTLRATLWLPRGATGPLPTVIVRNPYGGGDRVEWGQCVLAERGFAVLLQDTRGRFGSDGSFVPVEHEREDGAASVRWVRHQPWCDGRVAVFGASYLGLTAWAAVGGLSPEEQVQAIVPVITQARVRTVLFNEGGAVSLELIVHWLALVFKLLAASTARGLLRTCWQMWLESFYSTCSACAPLCKLDTAVLGEPWDFMQQALADESVDGPFWASRDVLCELRVGRPGKVIPPPVHIISCWHDFFLRQTLQDFSDAAQTQPSSRLTVGAFTHWSMVSVQGLQLMFRGALQTLDEHMPLQDHLPRPTSTPRASVRRRPPLPSFAAARSAAEQSLPVQLCFLISRRWAGAACRISFVGGPHHSSLSVHAARPLVGAPPTHARRLLELASIRSHIRSRIPDLGWWPLL